MQSLTSHARPAGGSVSLSGTAELPFALTSLEKELQASHTKPRE